MQRDHGLMSSTLFKKSKGAIGNVYFGKAWYANNRPPIGKGKIVPVPEWLDWELWQGLLHSTPL